MKNLLFISVFILSFTPIYAIEKNTKEELIHKILLPKEEEKLLSLEILGPIGLELKEITKLLGPEAEKFETLLIAELNKELNKLSGLDHPDTLKAYSDYFTEEELKQIHDLQKDPVWKLTNNSQFASYMGLSSQKAMMGEGFFQFMNSLFKHMLQKISEADVDEKILAITRKLMLEDFEKSEMIQKLKEASNQIESQMKQINLPKAKDGITAEKLALTFEYSTFVLNHEQMINLVTELFKSIFMQLEKQTGADPKLEKAIQFFNETELQKHFEEFFKNTVFKTYATAMAELFTLDELKQIITLQKQPLVQKLQHFSLNILAPLILKIATQQAMSDMQQGTGFHKRALQNAIEKTKAKGINTQKIEEALQKMK